MAAFTEDDLFRMQDQPGRSQLHQDEIDNLVGEVRRLVDGRENAAFGARRDAIRECISVLKDIDDPDAEAMPGVQQAINRLEELLEKDDD